MANTLLDRVIKTLAPSLDENGLIDLDAALELVGNLDFSAAGLDPLAYFEELGTEFEINPAERTLRVLNHAPAVPTYVVDDEVTVYPAEEDGGKKYPIPPRDFQYNGKLIKLMNALADDSTPEEGLYFAQFAKAAKDHNLALPPHEDKLLNYLRLYPKVFTITVDPSASQKIFIKPIKGFKSYKKDLSKKAAFEKAPYGNPPHGPAAYAAPAAAPAARERRLSLYSLTDFAYFADIAGALKSLYEMAAPAEGCFVIDGDVNPYRMYWNKLERDFAEAIRREDSDGEQLFLMSPIGADFPTGFTTPAGVRIFASCEFNKLRNAESYQPWRFTGFYAEEENM